MLRYQSETTAALEKEYLKVFYKRTAYHRPGPNRDIVLYREFLAYEAALHVRFNWAVELDRKTNPKKYSGLRLGARRLRYNAMYKKAIEPLDEALNYYRNYFNMNK